MKLRRTLVALIVSTAATLPVWANITSTSLRIQGAGLRVINDPPVTTGIDMPVSIQTEFGGKQNDEAVAIDGVIAVGELTGPGLDTPIQLTTAPGHKFEIPGLSQAGTFYLQNIRLMKGTEFLQYATPAVATITVADLLQTKVTVRQLSADELRARGITLDARNFDVYEFSFTFIIDGKEVVIPFPVIVDPRTHQVQPVRKETPYVLPDPKLIEPPRWSPPEVLPIEFLPEPAELPEPGEDPKEPKARPGRPSIPAAIVIPNRLAVLHQFFAVSLMVTNGAPEGSAARLEDLRATIRMPNALRTVKTLPQVAFGQPVPIVDPKTGTTFLVAQGRGEAEWTLEGLQPGTHRIDLELNAVLRQPGQDDLPLRATPSTSIVIHDNRFNINFSHPEVVRKGTEYSTYAFITNTSAISQTLSITNAVQSCDVNPGANVCVVRSTDPGLMTIPAGDMRLIEYRLRSNVTGQVFATTGTISDTAVVNASVSLHMGVSESGIPLSPATLVMPHYAQYVEPDLVSANLELLGLGYSLATAPLTQTTAKFPRVIKTDVFARAIDISRAGQRIFITDGAGKRDAIAHLALDLLGNGGHELRQWDELRRSEESGRSAGASVVRELEKAAFVEGATMTSVFDAFASAAAHRETFVAALAHGAAAGETPYAVALRGRTTDKRTEVANEAASGWVRGVPFSDISRFNGGGEQGELALVGRWTEDLDVFVTPAADGAFTIDLLYPATESGRMMRASFQLTGTKGESIVIPLTRGATSLNALLANGGVAAVGSVTTVTPEPLRVLGARQDLYLDEDGHKVSLLFNRPVKTPEGDLRTKFTGAIDFNRDSVVYKAARPIFAAALQEDSRVVNLSFNHALSVNATYTIETGSMIDPSTSSPVTFAGVTVPKIDNDTPAGVVYGKVLKGDNTPIAGADVILTQYLPVNPEKFPMGTPQYDRSQQDGSFLFEFVRRQSDAGWWGAYRLEGKSTVHGHTTVEGLVRLPGRVQFINLQYLGRGAAEGYVKYNDGSVVAGAKVVVGSTLFDQIRDTVANAQGFYRIEDLPVGPLTFSAQDEKGNVAFAAAEVATPGQLVRQDLSIYRQPFPGIGRVYGTVRRSDTNAALAGVRVGVYSQGYGLRSGYTDAQGRYDFDKVPAGFVTVLAVDGAVAPQSVAIDFDLKADEDRQVDVLLFVPQQTQGTATLNGEVRRENPLQPGTYEPVPGAMVKIEGYRIVTADSTGKFRYEGVPLVLSNANITAYDPATRRIKKVTMPTLTEAGPNNVAILINAFDRGSGTVRVRLLSAAGRPVAGYRVIEPGFPPVKLREVTSGVYELRDVPVGVISSICAVPGGSRPTSGEPDPRPYGDQIACDSIGVSFNGQIAPLTLQLPGEGTVRVKVRSQFDLITDVHLEYSVWDEVEQMRKRLTIAESTNKNGNADYAVFTKIPAIQSYGVASAHPQHGNAGVSAALAFDGDVRDHLLQLTTLASVRGTVYAIDGTTPIAGATVRIQNGRSDPGPQITGPDGRFEFTDQPAATYVSVTADVTQDGVYRTGIGSAQTPPNGGVVENVSVVLRKRGFVDGRIVYRDYKKFDPNNAANNVADDTPNDFSDNAPVPLAKFHLRELDFPQRSFGKATEPLTADASGRFLLGNIFVGALRASAWDPDNEELRGHWRGSIEEEGAEASPRAYIAIGGGGVGEAQITVVDPNQSYAPVMNAEVVLGFAGGGAFDVGSTDANGTVTFSQLPVGNYRASAYAKSLGKTSQTETFSVVRDGVGTARLRLEFSGVVEGTLTDPEEQGAAVPGAHVRLEGSGYGTQSTTNSDGYFLFAGVREGTFTLSAKDTDTNRRAKSEPRTLSVLDERVPVPLQLEPIETLHFAMYLPDDTGANSGVLGPPMQVEAVQRCYYDLGGVRHCDYERQLQGNPLQFPGMFKNSGYGIGIFVPNEPTVGTGGAFPLGSAANPLKYVWPAYGEVRVKVTQGGAPASGARVHVSGSNKQITIYTDTNGEGVARGLRLGDVSAQATSVDERFSGRAAARLERQSVPVSLTIALGTYAGVTGYVEAEAGGPSAGTRVVAHFGTHAAEVRTDSAGRYTILGIATPPNGATRVDLTFIGPDDKTVGAHAFKDVRDGDKVVEAPPVKLDATPPQLESIVPADGARDVSPDSSIVITFSEPLKANAINGNTFRLLGIDSTTNVNCALTSTTLADGRFVVTMTPPKPASGFPLRSNTLYRVIVDGSVTDLTGHKLPSTRGFTFTTSDYTEPRVQKVLPASPIPRATSFEFRFNEQIDPAPWATGGNGVFHIYKLAAPGGAAASIARELASRAFVDPATTAALFIVPNEPDRIEPESFYRVVFNGVRDPQGNVLGEQTFHFTSYDEVSPHVLFTAPAASEQLVTGSEYEIRLDLRNGSASGTPATDVKLVRYYTIGADGLARQFAVVQQAPFSTRIIAPEVPEGGAQYTLAAQATDTSGNEGPQTTITWTVKQNAAPTNVAIAKQQASAFPSTQIAAAVTFHDEGTFATVTMNIAVPKNDGTEESVSLTKSVSRVAGGAWPDALFTHTLPATAKPGALVTLTARVRDIRGVDSAAVTETIEIAADTLQPTIVSVTPPPGTTYFNRDRFTIEATVSDGETGVQNVTFSVDGESYAVASVTNTSTPGTKKFRSVEIEAKAKAEDAEIPIVVTAKDYNGNSRSKTYNVLYKGVQDPDAPKVTWLCPSDRGAIPAQRSFPLRLRVRVIDEDVRAVKFILGTETPVTLTAAAVTPTEYEIVHTFTTPAPGQLTVTAVVEDTVASHTVELPITLDLVAVDYAFTDPKAITVDAAPTYTGKTIAVIGTNAVLAPQAPLQLANLLVLNGGSVQTLATTTLREFRVDVTTTGVTYVDCDSRIDVTAKGYAGGWQSTADGRNDDSRGRTVGNTTAGGADTSAQGTHAGLGGIAVSGTTNAPYGSIFAPTDLGSGGGGAPTCCTAGASGGGAIALRGGSGENDLSRIVIGGTVRADGGQGFGGSVWAAGSGGSVWIDAKQVVFGAKAQVTANGGDDDGLNLGSWGAGGGRVAIAASTKLDAGTAVVEARGGRNHNQPEVRQVSDGGAGTVLIRKPGQETGELIVSSHDSRYPTSLHTTTPTPLGRIGSGTSTAVASNALTDTSRTFDRWMIGEELVIGGDTSRTFTVTAVSSDRKTLHTDPQDGNLVDAANSQTAAYAGLLRFDRVKAGNRALLVFENHVSAAGSIDDKDAMTVDASAAVVLKNEQPALTITTTPDAGGNVVRDSTMSTTYSARSAAGVRSVTLTWSGGGAPTVDTYNDSPVETTPKTHSVEIPQATPLGEATLTARVVDRAGRSFDLPARKYNVTENAAPVIESFTIVPQSLEVHAGGDVVASVVAGDDLAVKSVAFDARLDGTSLKSASFAPNTAQASQTFTVSIPKTAAARSAVVIDVAVGDGFTGRAPTTATQTVTISADTVAPQLTVVGPAAGSSYREGVDKIPVRVTAMDAEVAVKEVFAALNGATPVALEQVGSTHEWRADIVAPPVEATAPVTRTLTITAKDYAGNATVSDAISLTIKPIIDANAPVLKWLCASPGAMYPPGHSVRVRLSAAVASSQAENAVQTVTMTTDDGTALAVTNVSTGVYETTFAIPASAADGTTYHIRATATTFGGSAAELVTTLAVAVPTVAAITADTTIEATNTIYDGQTVLISGGTVTIKGAHTFDRLIVLGGKVTHVSGALLDIAASRGIYVGCDGSIDTSGRGYAPATTYPGATRPGWLSAGSHMGFGALYDAPLGSTFGSLYRPSEAGGGGHRAGTGAGGGIVRINAGMVINDGAIRANGAGHEDAGAGGSVWIKATSVGGGGRVEARGGDGHRSGGGGAVAVEYSSASGTVLDNASAAGGSTNRAGGAGTVYLKRGTGNGELRVDNGGVDAQLTELPSLGRGVAASGTSGATLVTDRTADVPPYFAGHWVEVTGANGTVKGSWRIASVSGRSVTLSPNAGETIDLTAGDKWQGVYVFDTLRVSNGGKVRSQDVIRATSITTPQGSTELITPIEATNVTIGGTTWASDLTATNLTVEGALRQYGTGGTASLQLNVSGTLTITATGSIDASGRGYAPATTYPGATRPGWLSAGSHMGFGALYDGPLGSTFGSLYRPSEAGGGGHRAGTGAGGGMVRINAGTVMNDGAIRANGAGHEDAGAGGSVWIKATSIGGTGRIEARGGDGHRSGGGGAVAVEYSSASGTVLGNAIAPGGSTNRAGGPGTVYLKREGATYGDVRIDNGTVSGQSTALPSLGRGVVVSVSGGNVILTDAPPFPIYFVGHWVDIFSSDGARKGTWRIGEIAGSSFTLEGSPVVAAGDTWRGVYVFEKITLRNAKVLLLDDIRGTRETDGTSTITINDAPVFDADKRSAIVVDSRGFTAVTGPAGAVSDLHPPIRMTATNTRTLQTYTANAATDGSFRIDVAGDIGDTFTVRATDSFSIPATSVSIPVNGAIANTNSVTSVAIEPSVTTGGSTLAGAVRMTYPVINGGNVVALQSSSAAAVVPATITIPVGVSSATFDVLTSSVSSDTTVTITATSNGTSASATLTLLGGTSALAQLVLDEPTVESGTSINGILVLGAPAPAGGASVTVSSSDTRLATVPTVVLVPEGATSAAFTVTTYRVDATASVTISATYGASLSASATLNECTALSAVTPPSTADLATTWVDDAVPAGATQSGDGVFDSTQAALGSSSIHLSGASAGVRTFAFTGAAALTVRPEDSLIVYALINPCDPPRQLMIGWKATSEYRASWGENRIDPVTTPSTRVGSVPRGGEWTRLEVPARRLGITAAVSITALTIRAVDGEAWFDAVGTRACAAGTVKAPQPELAANELLWFDDALPQGATADTAAGTVEAWTWDTTQVASGNASHLSPARAGFHDHVLRGATDGFSLTRADVLTTWVYLDPCNPPRMILLQWNDGTSWEHRAYWGENLSPFGTSGAGRYRAGPLPPTGGWVRLEVPATAVDLDGKTIVDMALGVHDGQAWFDAVGRMPRVNLSLGKTARQSTDYSANDKAHLAVDGTLASGHGTMSVTAHQSRPWWQVDLGGVYPIDSIDVHGRTDCCEWQTGRFWLFVADAPFPETNDPAVIRAQAGVSSYYIPSPAGALLSVTVGRTGRYVRIHMDRTDHLSLPEVEVWSAPAARRVSVAAGRDTVTASSVYDSNTPPHAGVNGTANQPYPHGGSIFHTRSGTETNPWWEVDLGAVKPISTVDLWARASCCTDQMTSFWVLMSDTPIPPMSSGIDAVAASPGVSVYYHGTAQLPVVSIPVNRTARYIRFHRAGNTFISFAELQAWSQQPAIGAFSTPGESPPDR